MPMRLNREDETSRELILPHSRNCLFTYFPTRSTDIANVEKEQVLKTRLQDMERKRNAARATLDRFCVRARDAPTIIAGTLASLERPLETVIETLDDIAMRTMVETVIPDTTDGSNVPKPEHIDTDITNSVKIIKTDDNLIFKNDFHMDFLTTVFSTEVIGRVGFGQWFLAIQTSLISNHRDLERNLRTINGSRVSQRFMRTAIRACSSAMEIYAGRRDYSAFEATVLCLFQFQLIKRGFHEGRQPEMITSFNELIRNVPVYLRELANEISHSWADANFAFDSSKLPTDFFSPIDGSSYPPHALNTHVIYRIFKARGVFPIGSKDVTKHNLENIDPGFTRFEDPIARLSLSFFPERKNPLTLHNDEPMIRMVVNTVSVLLLIQRFLYNSDVHGPAYANRFQLAIFFDRDIEQSRRVQPPASEYTDSSHDTNVHREDASRDNNLFFLFANYLLNIYRVLPGLEISGFFPGAIILCLIGRLRGIPSTHHLGDFYRSLIELIALDLRKTSNVGMGAISVLMAHDTLTMDCERGLARLLSVIDIKGHLRGIMRTLNIGTDSDLIYFLCIGCIPVHVTV
ncbi:DNA packaging tegument protein [Psittacid alphaherpesvirus 5]|uniref:DNA packaging tegument protein n=1 Tax=Psittacid alphaherpesvirus 5 TaxID=2972693 RepID=A0A5P9JNX9_9ALPH|nr:DNA packaging tegument protein [Psittacid alphaherpesvirus 5]QFU14562.1 DNA packaging tegument protein [Psittacid alphaherpesvirus 5]UOO01033.1 DNA packaging tegument protein [Psittacid alphaherpesvirus 5]